MKELKELIPLPQIEMAELGDYEKSFQEAIASGKMVEEAKRMRDLVKEQVSVLNLIVEKKFKIVAIGEEGFVDLTTIKGQDVEVLLENGKTALDHISNLVVLLEANE